MDEITDIDNLLSSLEPTPRMLVLMNPNETNLLGVIEDETEDSFLVFMPARLVKNDSSEEMRVVSFIPQKFMRLMKANVLMVVELTEPFSSHYDKYLKESHSSDILPPASQEEVSSVMTPEELEQHLEKIAEKGGLHHVRSVRKH